MGNRWAAVLPQLRQIPGLRCWHIKNRRAIQSNAIIAALKEAGLAGEISVTPVGDAFTLSGVLDESGKGRLEQLRAQFAGLALSYQAVPASADGGGHHSWSPQCLPGAGKRRTPAGRPPIAGRR